MRKVSASKCARIALALAALPIAVSANAPADAPAVVAEAAFDRFAPSAPTAATRLDYSVWDGALRWFVLPMGVSLRETARRTDSSSGSRLLFGQDSIYRLEGNKIAFSFLDGRQRAALTEYRRDLERVGSTVGLTHLSRNEQLAYWINLHNVAVIEQIALAYPVSSPRKIRIGGVPLDEARFITVSGVAMSPRDIRTRIVYPNWRDPRVIYGFFRGEIGGPSLPRRAFTAANVAQTLDESANEFVNALRGVSRSGKRMRVSEIYLEARPFFFADFSPDLRAHLARFADTDVRGILADTERVTADISESDIADLSKGEQDSPISPIDQCQFDPTMRLPTNCRAVPGDANLAVNSFLEERAAKIERLIRAGKVGRVIVSDAEEPTGGEVE